MELVFASLFGGMWNKPVKIGAEKSANGAGFAHMASRQTAEIWALKVSGIVELRKLSLPVFDCLPKLI